MICKLSPDLGTTPTGLPTIPAPLASRFGWAENFGGAGAPVFAESVGGERAPALVENFDGAGTPIFAENFAWGRSSSHYKTPWLCGSTGHHPHLIHWRTIPFQPFLCCRSTNPAANFDGVGVRYIFLHSSTTHFGGAGAPATTCAPLFGGLSRFSRSHDGLEPQQQLMG